MSAKTVVVTGASDGIGAEAARRLAHDGHRVSITGRSPEKTAAVAADTGGEYFVADFARLDDVRRLAREISADVDSIDVLINNAGGIFGQREVTQDGHEKTFQVNYLAPFLLTTLLLDALLAGDGVVVNVASSAAKVMARFDFGDLDSEISYSPNRAYGNAKLGNILFTRGLQDRFGERGIRSVAVDPGNIRTNFAAESTSWVRLVYRTPLSRLFLQSTAKGGDNLVFFAEGTPGQDWLPGGFYTQTRLAAESATNPLVYDDVLVHALWERSQELVSVTT